MKKKLFFLINSLEAGGAERVLSNIVFPLSKKYEVTIYTLKDSKSFYNIKGIKVVSLNKTKSNLFFLFSFFFLLLKFKKILRENKGVQVISFLELSNFLNILINRNAIISFRTSHLYFKNSKHLKDKVLLFFISLFYKRAKWIIVNSKQNKIDLARFLNYDENNIFVIYNLISEKFLNKKIKFAQKIKKFVTVGRFVSLKNYFLLVKLFEKLSEFELFIYGEGPDFLRIKKYLIDNNIENIKLMGTNKNLEKELVKYDIFIFASKIEGFPNVLIEAMSLGLPIVTSNFKPSSLEIIDPKHYNKKVNYPYFGPNGVILDLDHFILQFENIVSKLNLLKQKQEGLELFKKENVIKDWIEVIDKCVE